MITAEAPPGVALVGNEKETSAVLPNAPTSSSSRISGIDVLRGVALLGILVLNIDDFGNPELMHDVPVGLPVNAFAGPHAHLNLALLMLKWMFFEGKMRGLFSMLFGAGVILLTGRAERRGRSDTADIFARRNLLLLLFGVLHACFIWHGDILFDYGFQALLFLYPARKLQARTLLWLGTGLSLTVATLGAFLFLGASHDLGLHRQVQTVQAKQRAGIALTAEDKTQLQQWNERVEANRITPQKTADAMKEASLSYPDSVLARQRGLS
jgi:uncharacterized protein